MQRSSVPLRLRCRGPDRGNEPCAGNCRPCSGQFRAQSDKPRAASRPTDVRGNGIRANSACEPSLVLGVADSDFDKGRIALGKPDRDAVPDDPEHEPREPEPQAEREHSRKRAKQDRGGARRASDQNRLSQRAVENKFKAIASHQISAPPPNEKNDRKNELAANAMDRPNTTWTIFRKP